jgi:phosphoglycerate dehydrogenase-like enzyme
MANHKPNILLMFNRSVRERYLPPQQLERLQALANWDWFDCQGGGIYQSHRDPATIQRLLEQVEEIDGMVVCHGAPRIDAEILDRASHLKFIGELEGDRFAARIDLEACWQRGIRTVDTTQGSSYPVAEWALALMLVSLRNAGAMFRQIIAGTPLAERRSESSRACFMANELDSSDVDIWDGG